VHRRDAALPNGDARHDPGDKSGKRRRIQRTVDDHRHEPGCGRDDPVAPGVQATEHIAARRIRT
jgi:hypothetical protein